MIEILQSNFLPKSDFLADCIFYFHIFVILFVLFIPFSNLPPIFLILHIVSCLSLMVHWWGNSDVCCLTIMEGQLRGIDRTETFTHQLISPIYKISSKEFSSIVWLITIFVMFVSIYKVYNTDKFKTALKCYYEKDFSFEHTIKCIRPLFMY